MTDIEPTPEAPEAPDADDLVAADDAARADHHPYFDAIAIVLAVELGRAKMTLSEIKELRSGSVVELNRSAGAPIDLLANGKVIAKGEIVVMDEQFGLRITELTDPTAVTLD